MKDTRSMALDSIVDDARSYGAGRKKPSRQFMIAIGVPDDEHEESMEGEGMDEPMHESEMFDNDLPYEGEHNEPDEDDEMLARLAELLARRR